MLLPNSLKEKKMPIVEIVMNITGATVFGILGMMFFMTEVFDEAEEEAPIKDMAKWFVVGIIIYIIFGLMITAIWL
jgi:hypothetical protein